MMRAGGLDSALPITGVGAVASVGRTVADVCASIRAGLSRAQALDYYLSPDPETQELVPVSGHPVQALTEGFLLFGAWQRLARAALDDLVARHRLPDASDRGFWERTALSCVLPELDEERFQSGSEHAGQAIADAYSGPVGRHVGLAPPSAGHRIYCGGHAGMAPAMLDAGAMLADGEVDRVVVLGVDSYLDTPCLEWLDGAGRLKTGAAPTGLAPGEAGACIMFEHSAAAQSRGASVIASVDAATQRMDSGWDAQDADTVGTGMAAALKVLLGNASPDSLDLLTDQNGESWRAMQLAYAQLRLPQLAETELKVATPFASTGDIGAAWGPLATALAIHAFRRGYAPAHSLLVVASSDSGAVGAWWVTRASSKSSP